jgi:uncharacterized heparinase superfamily protein
MTASARIEWRRSWREILSDLRFANPLYRLTLMGGAPRKLTRVPPDALPGDAGRGAAVLAGKFFCAGHAIVADRPDWYGSTTSVAALAELHGFGWLRDLAAQGGAAAQQRARDLIADWLDHEHGWHRVAWAPGVIGARVAAWLEHAKFIARGDGDDLGQRILASLARQLRHLWRVVETGDDGAERLAAIKGLIYGIHCGIADARRTEAALSLLARELARQVLPDGGHVERSPQVQLVALATLIDIRDMLRLAARDPTSELAAAITRMAALLRFFRHGDGGLALFNDSTEGNPALIDLVLARSESKERPPAEAPQTGFQRLAAERVVVLFDTGAPPPRGLDRHAHAGTLSFELSFGKERLIVNCGAQESADPSWRDAQRTTAAHSTITVDDVNSSEVMSRAGLGRRVTQVTCEREEAEGNVWITASHNGYLAPFGLIHRRRLYLSQDGQDFRGEDSLTGAHKGTFALRFHLHPDVSASIIQNGAAALIRLPSGAAWRLQTNGGAMALVESVYLGRRQEARRGEQVVLTGRLAGEGASIKWALKRMAKV